MQTTSHQVEFCNANSMQNVSSESIHLVVTSPPYPMIQMWDEIFCEQNPKISKHLISGNGQLAFDLMHNELSKVWKEVDRVLVPGGISCINMGDATRTINQNFCLYPNHHKVIEKFLNLGHVNLPNILWRKVTNAPNKFMGSGMMPPGAYVTLEHEWILIFRKNRKRSFTSMADKMNRRESSFFWEERNAWFSDLWNLRGVSQKLNNGKSRDRSASFPFEIPYRLINMFSVKGDMVLDPFLGTGTTTLAAIACERNSIGIEISTSLEETINERITTLPISKFRTITDQRLSRHREFIENYYKPPRYYNKFHDFPVITQVEEDIKMRTLCNILQSQTGFIAQYSSGQHDASSILDSSNVIEIEPSVSSL